MHYSKFTPKLIPVVAKLGIATEACHAALISLQGCLGAATELGNEH